MRLGPPWIRTLFCVCAGLSFGLGTGLYIGNRRTERNCSLVASNTARLLDERRQNLSAEARRLAERFGRWEIRPRAAIRQSLRASLRHRTDIDELRVFDPNGLLVEHFSLLARPGVRRKRDEMDPEDWRRRTVVQRAVPFQTYRVIAGRVEAVEATAPILGDGVEGYVVARVAMHRVFHGIPDKGRIEIRDKSCGLLPPGPGCRVDSVAGPWTVEVSCPKSPIWPYGLAGLLFALAALWLKNSPSSGTGKGSHN